MSEADLFLHFVRRLNGLHVTHMITGSVASTAYGEPRLTHDVDIVLVVHAEDAKRLHKAFPPDEFYCPPPEVIGEESARNSGGHFNLIHHSTGFKADCYTAGADPLHVWGLRHSRRIELDGEPVFLAPPEYVIVRKLQYYKESGFERHLRDIEGMLAVSGELIDNQALQYWLTEKAVSDAWSKVKKPADG
jgi:hypothetical protein